MLTTGRARAVWSTCLASAFRTALACTVVGVTTLYGPASLLRQVAFPAFSYVTVILIVTDATLGDTLHGCWLALYATFQSLGPAILSLWLIGPARLTSSTTALAVGLAGFVVAMPETTHMVAKRIGLGQIVIVYVLGYINGERTEAVMHPVHVAASTALGVLACVLALLLPFPRLACLEVKHNCKLLADNASERLNLFVKAFCAEDNTSALAYVSQAKSLSLTGTKLLQSIKRYQESTKWELFPMKLFRPNDTNPSEKFQDLEIPLRGMEMALASNPCFPVSILNGELKESLTGHEEHINLTIKQPNTCLPGNSLTVPESNAENVIKSLQISPDSMPKSHKDLLPFFFLFCLKILHTKSLAKPTSAHKNETRTISCKKSGISLKGIWGSLGMKLTTERLMPAFKCSLSLGFSVLFGLLYSKENGYWSGLPVAISFATAREATFKVANLKAQGTVLGTVYGVLGCFLFESHLPVRFMSLFPWFIFTSFLRRSEMYGKAGGISAVIGAVLILGRENFGTPTEFAITRIVETFIGLSCSIFVELLLHPTRASTLAKTQLSKTLGKLHECVDSIGLEVSKTNLVENQNKLKMHINELKNLIGEADVEPNFWFLPFNSACYGKFLASLSNMVDFLLFGSQIIGFLERESQKQQAGSWKGISKKLDADLELFKEVVGSLVKCFEEVASVKSLKVLVENNISCDLELGKSPKSNYFWESSSSETDEQMEKIMSSYLQHADEVVQKIIQAAEDDHQKELKSQMVLSLSALGYCLKCLIRETREIELGIKELIQSENPSSHIKLQEIACKIRASNR